MQVKSSPKAQNFLSSAAGTRFRKLVGMLGSAHAGEAGNAALMASRLLREADLTWGEVLGAGTSSGSSFSQESFTRRIQALEQQLSMQKSYTEKARKDVEIWQRKFNESVARSSKLAAELEAARRAFTATVNDMKDGTRQSKASGGLHVNGGGDQEYASPLHFEINQLIDSIEDGAEIKWDREIAFLKSARELKWKVTPKQYDWLKSIAERAGIDIGNYKLGQ